MLAVSKSVTPKNLCFISDQGQSIKIDCIFELEGSSFNFFHKTKFISPFIAYCSCSGLGFESLCPVGYSELLKVERLICLDYSEQSILESDELEDPLVGC